jgi:hypothetical protein
LTKSQFHRNLVVRFNGSGPNGLEGFNAQE